MKKWSFDPKKHFNRQIFIKYSTSLKEPEKRGEAIIAKPLYGLIIFFTIICTKGSSTLFKVLERFGAFHFFLDP